MEPVDWRDQVQRKRIVNKIMDVLKKHLPFTGYERLQELKQIAERVEEEIYTDATSQSEYSRKICYMILTMETRLQNYVSDPMQSEPGVNRLFDSMVQTRNPNSEDWQEEVYHKINTMKDLYLLDLRATQGTSGGIGDLTLDSGDWRTKLQADSRQRVTNKIYDTLKKHLPLYGPAGLQEIKKLAVSFEERMYATTTSQSDYLRKISLKMLTMENKYPVSDRRQ